MSTHLTGAVLPHARSLTTGDIIISGSARVHIGDSNAYSTLLESPEKIGARLIASLASPHMYDRFEHVTEAFPNTYQWLLQQSAPYTEQHDCFAAWISDQSSHNRLYWIHGKPGSGKSTVMKFLFNSLSAEYLGTIWPNSGRIVRAHHFFWSSGTVLQNSVDGLCRSLIIQVLDSRPDLLHCVMSSLRLMGLGDHTITWSRKKLMQALLDLVRVVTQNSYLLLIIDGLDECGGNAEEQDELLDLLLSLAEFEKTKICVASRAWNGPREAFVGRPQLRLEHLTQADIKIFVEDQLSRSRRWWSLKTQRKYEAISLTSNIVTKAEGVFLWVRLVVRDILQGLRDGDNISELQQTLNAISPELDTYFMTILHSIEHKYRREASTLLQLALFQESKYVSVLSMTLMDTFFMAETREDFATRGNRKSPSIDLRNRENFLSLIDSTKRKLISRCKGLLECDFEQLGESDDSDGAHYLDSPAQGPISIANNVTHSGPDWIEEGFQLNVQLLHRSLRDFLSHPNVRDFLYQYTDNRPLDARLFLGSARALQLQALDSVGYYRGLTVGIASHLLSAMWVNRTSENSRLLGEKIRGSIERLAAHGDFDGDWGWYLDDTLKPWHLEQSNFLSLAIDFDLSSYISAFMTPLAISQKNGRPILDHILRPRFVTIGRPGCEWVNPKLVKTALSRGSDPNEIVIETGSSVWATYLCFLADTTVFWESNGSALSKTRSSATFEVLLALIHAGAASMLPIDWLASPPMSVYFGTLGMGQLRRQWTNELAQDQSQKETVAASSLIRSMGECFRFDIQPLIDQLNEGESEPSLHERDP